MKIELWIVGKTHPAYLKEGIEIYLKRIKRYLPFDHTIIPDIRGAKNLTPEVLKSKEGAAVLDRLQAQDHLILLDEVGHQLSSVEFAHFLDHQLQRSYRRIVFLIGGAYGFSDEIYQRADKKLSLSKMTFSHQMIRLFFAEQFYRALTILRHEPYHNE